MKIIVSGTSGLVGSALIQSLAKKGHSICRLVRDKASMGNYGMADENIFWDPKTGAIEKTASEGHDALIHLAGKNIASDRWTPEVKKELYESRVLASRSLAETFSKLENPPKVIIAASAIGYYGNTDDVLVNEGSSSGSGFLPDMCKDWEDAWRIAKEHKIRIVNMRIGVVMSKKGGALSRMLVPFKLGLGGIIGTGKQYMSWISLKDLVGAIEFALNNKNISGPVNAVAPQAITNLEFTKTLGKVLGRPTIFPMPAFAARLAFGEMADDILLSSTRVEPKILTASGYTFQFPQLESALRDILVLDLD